MLSTNNNQNSQNKQPKSNYSNNMTKNKNKNINKNLTFTLTDDSKDGFTLQKNKRHLSSTSFTSTLDPLTLSTLTKNKNKKLFKTKNRFEALSQDEPHEENLMNDIFVQNSHNDTLKPPPPIFIRGVNDYTEVCTKLIDLIGVDNFFCKSSGDRLKIQISNPDAYRTLVRYLKKENAKFHTYQLKEDKSIRIVV